MVIEEGKAVLNNIVNTRGLSLAIKMAPKELKSIGFIVCNGSERMQSFTIPYR